MTPKEWLSTTLGKVMTFKNGLNFTKTDAGEEIKIVGVSDFKDFAELRNAENLATINVATKIKDDELLANGDLLFVRSNGNKDLIGRCLFFPEIKERLSFSGFTIRGRADKSIVFPEYVASLARSTFFKQKISEGGGGTNISNLSQQILNDIPLILPPLWEQKKIAQILSTWGQAITTTERLLDIAHQQKKALLQQILTGKKRFLGFEGQWKRVRLGEILNVRKEKQVPDETTPLYSLTIENGITAKTERYNREFLVKDSNEKKYKVVKPNDIVYNPANLRWGAINYSRISHSVVVSPIYEVLYVKKPDLVCLEFVAQSLMSTDQINRFAAMVEGTLVERMAVKIEPFLAIKIPLPASRQEQQKIADVLTCCDQEIKTLQSQLDGLKQEKKALMQVLLTGQRRVHFN